MLHAARVGHVLPVGVLLVLERAQHEDVQVARAHPRVQRVGGGAHRVAVQLEREFLRVEPVVHVRDRRAGLQAAAAHRQRVAGQRERQPAARRRQPGDGERVAEAERAVHRQQRTRAAGAEAARAVHVGVELARVARLGLRRHDERGGARLRAGGDLEARRDAAQVVDEEDDPLDLLHVEHAARHEAGEVRLDDVALHRQVVGPAQHDAIEAAFEHADAHDAVARRLLGNVRIAEVVAEVALQEAGDLGGGVDEVFVAPARADVRRVEPRQRLAQRGGRVGGHRIGLHVERDLVLRLAELARGRARRQLLRVGGRGGGTRGELGGPRHLGRGSHDRRLRLRQRADRNEEAADRERAATRRRAQPLHPDSRSCIGRHRTEWATRHDLLYRAVPSHRGPMPAHARAIV